MKLALKILSIIFALASIGQLIAGKFWPIGIVLAVVCGFFGFRKSSNEKGGKDKDRETKEKIREDMGLSEETPDELLEAAKRMKEGDTEGAVEMMRKEEDPASYYFDKGKELAIWEDDHKSAIDLFTKGINLGDTKYLPHFYGLRSDSKFKIGDINGALDDINRAIEILDGEESVDMADFLERRAKIRDENGNNEGANKDRDKAENIRDDS